jgi:hypothetical protein
MPAETIELNPVARITTGAIGTPGQRIFYFQARQAGQVVTLIVEKAQIQSLAVGVGRFSPSSTSAFRRWSKPTAATCEREMASEQPLDPAFRGDNSASDTMRSRPADPGGQTAQAEERTRGGHGGAVLVPRSQILALCRWGMELAGPRPSDLRQLRRADRRRRTLLPQAQWTQESSDEWLVASG